MTPFMKSVLKRIKERREKVHKRCKKILGNRGLEYMYVSKLACSSKGTHF